MNKEIIVDEFEFQYRWRWSCTVYAENVDSAKKILKKIINSDAELRPFDEGSIGTVGHIPVRMKGKSSGTQAYWKKKRREL